MKRKTLIAIIIVITALVTVVPSTTATRKLFTGKLDTYLWDFDDMGRDINFGKKIVNGYWEIRLERGNLVCEGYWIELNVQPPDPDPLGTYYIVIFRMVDSTPNYDIQEKTAEIIGTVYFKKMTQDGTVTTGEEIYSDMSLNGYRYSDQFSVYCYYDDSYLGGIEFHGNLDHPVTRGMINRLFN